MTYLQLMTKCLSFFKNEKDAFDSYNFYYYWLGNDEIDIDSYYKSKSRKAIMYLILLETKNYGNPNNFLLKLLEKDLSFYDISVCKTLEKVEETVTSIIEDPFMLDQLCLLEQDELSIREQNEIIKELINEFQRKMPDKCENQQYESAIHGVMEMVSQIIPELFFTEKGYKYIDNEYQIDDIQLREKCYEYVKENIKYYNSERIYKIDENVYSKLYEVKDELENFDDEFEDEENMFFDEDKMRGQVDIYGEDIDNYDILYYSTTLLVVILRFIKNKQYDKLERLIEIDESMTNFHDGYGFYYDKTFIESLYQPKTMVPDYHKEISTHPKSDFYLEFFLSNNKFTQQYNIQQLSLIIAHCFDLFDSEPINKMVKNIDRINNILATNNIDTREEKVKSLVRIKKDNK